MDRKQYFVRPFEDADYPDISRLFSIAHPEMPSDPDDERHWASVLAANHLVNENWVAVERASGRVVGLANLSQSPYSSHPHKFWTLVLVDPEHGHRGIGRALADLLESEAAEHRAVCFWTNVTKADSRSLAFAERIGYREMRTIWMSVLDLSETGEASPPEDSGARSMEGVRFTTLAEEGAERPEVQKRLYELLKETSRDVPRMGEYTPVPFEQFLVQLSAPMKLLDAHFLARVGDAYVATSELERDAVRPDSLLVGFTGTRADYRGRGIASELKRRSIDYARQHGIRYLRTINDSLNESIWSINQKLGFRRTVEWSNRERRFRPDEPSSAPAPRG